MLELTQLENDFASKVNEYAADFDKITHDERIKIVKELSDLNEKVNNAAHHLMKYYDYDPYDDEERFKKEILYAYNTYRLMILITKQERF